MPVRVLSLGFRVLIFPDLTCQFDMPVTVPISGLRGHKDQALTCQSRCLVQGFVFDVPFRVPS